LFHQLLGVTCFSIDPYQLGQENEEAIQSGSFWFYRKLGFRPVRSDVQTILEREEERLRRDPRQRTAPGTLRRLAAGHLLWERPGAPGGEWDRFQVRRLGLAVERAMKVRYGGDAGRMLRATAASAARVLGALPDKVPALGTWAPLLALIPGLAVWTPGEKRLLAGILRARLAPEEYRYARLLMQHGRLRKALLTLGSG
jgi:hypothetical protein